MSARASPLRPLYARGLQRSRRKAVVNGFVVCTSPYSSSMTLSEPKRFSLLIHAPKAKVPLREYQLQVGKASPTEGTLPSSVYIILKKLGAGDPKDGIV